MKLLKSLIVFIGLLYAEGCVHGKTQVTADKKMEKVRDAVYLLRYPDDKGKSIASASGFVIAYNGHKYMITAAHVCESIPTHANGYIYAYKNGLKWKLKVLKVSNIADLCLLRTPKDSKYLKLADALYRNDWVYIVGYPLMPYMTATYGRYKGPGIEQFEAAFLTDPLTQCISPKYSWRSKKTPHGPINVCYMKVEVAFSTALTGPGSSGGPVINNWGRVVGVSSGYQNPILPWSFMVKHDHLKAFLIKISN